MEAGRKRISVRQYEAVEDAWQESEAPDIFTIEEFAKSIRQPTLVCGELSAEAQKAVARKHKNVTLVSPAQGLRRPAFLAEIAWKRWQAGDVDDAPFLAPKYLQTGDNIPA